MNLIDIIHTQFPGFGVNKVRDRLRRKYGVNIEHGKTKRYMRSMNILKPAEENSSYGLYPYLLKGTDIHKPNQVWSIDITYIGMMDEFSYLVVIIDWYSRYVLSWDLSDSLKSDSVIVALTRALEKYGKPYIINSDNGSQFITAEYLEMMVDRKIRISMNRKGRPADNIAVERFFRSLKSERLHGYEIFNTEQAKESIDFYIPEYNEFRGHDRFKDSTPSDAYFQIKKV